MQKCGGVTTCRGSCEFIYVCMYMALANSCRWLAYTLICVDVALTVRASVCHILKVINETGDQAAAEITPVDEE